MYNEIKINVTKAKLSNITICFNDEGELPTVTAVINLYTANDKKISSFSVSTGNYYQVEQFDLPTTCIPIITELQSQLLTIAVQCCNKSLNLIEAKND